MVFDDFSVFSTFSTLVISDFTIWLAHENKTFRGKLYEQLLSKKFFLKSIVFEILSFEVSLLTTLEVQNKGKLQSLKLLAFHRSTCWL